MARPPRSVYELYTEARTGSRRALGRLLTLVERGGHDAETIAELANPDAGSAHIVGITGAPGAGKSTLTGRLVNLLVDSGKRPAVLAVDPSSPLTGGAILGDRIRMEGSLPGSAGPGAEPAPTAVTGDPPATAFIRSMATRGHSGGLALAVPLAVRLFDAMGYDPVIIETVGVGQVEVDVVAAADTAVVVMTPGMGDAVQANKAGLLEVADVFVVNKADRPGALDVRRDLELMLDLSHVTGQEDEGGYRPPIVLASALEGQGAADVWDAVVAHLAVLDETGRRQERRHHRIRTEIRARMAQTLASRIDEAMNSEMGSELVAMVEDASLSPAAASAKLLDRLLHNR
jgi:LAO/AO transport system kinase